MNIVEIMTSALCICSTICFGISGFARDKKGILRLHTICNVFDFIMYMILGAKSGMANSAASLMKNISYVKYESVRMTIVFACVRIALLYAGWEGYVTLAFMLMEVVVTVLTLCGRQQGLGLKVAVFVRQIVWLVYDFMFATAFIAMLTAIGTAMSFMGLVNNPDLKKSGLV